MIHGRLIISLFLLGWSEVERLVRYGIGIVGLRGFGWIGVRFVGFGVLFVVGLGFFRFRILLILFVRGFRSLYRIELVSLSILNLSSEYPISFSSKPPSNSLSPPKPLPISSTIPSKPPTSSPTTNQSS